MAQYGFARLRSSFLKSTAVALLVAAWLPICLLGGSHLAGLLGNGPAVEEPSITAWQVVHAPDQVLPEPPIRTPGSQVWLGKGTGPEASASAGLPHDDALRPGQLWSLIPTRPEYARTWQFARRAAGLPRAPSVA